MSLPEALVQSRDQVLENHKKHLNSGLTMMFGLLDFSKLFVKAQGCKVWDNQDQVYLDFLGAYGALNIGHNHPRLLEALTQIQTWPNLLQASLGALSGALAHNLAAITPENLQRCFFCNSGAEAVEGALKLARAATGKQRLVYCNDSFHGKTMGALSVTGRLKYQKAFQPLIKDTIAVPFGDLKALEDTIKDKKTAAFIVEPIQGEGGIIIPPAGYLAAAKDLCVKYDTLMILDEIQTGLGRTGSMFAFEQENIAPDILCLAKSLGGGIMPIGVFITSDSIWEKAYGGMEKALLHTSTFGGNSWATAAGIITLEIIFQEDLIGNAKVMGDYLLSGLKRLQEQHSLIKDVRGRGLLTGIEFRQVEGIAAKTLVGKLSQEYMGSLIAGELMNNHRIITAYSLNNPNVIRLEPPLCVTKTEIDTLLESLESILKNHKSFTGLVASGAKNKIKSLFK